MRFRWTSWCASPRSLAQRFASSPLLCSEASPSTQPHALLRQLLGSKGPASGEARRAVEGQPSRRQERSAAHGFQNLGLDLAPYARLHEQTQVYQAHVHAGGPSHANVAQASVVCKDLRRHFLCSRSNVGMLSDLQRKEHEKSPQEPRPGPTGLRHRPEEVHAPASCCGVASPSCRGSRAGRRPSPTSCQ